MVFVHLKSQLLHEEEESSELREIARKYADLVKDVNERIWRAYNEAYSEASGETGVREEALFRVATYFNLVLDNYGYSEIAKLEKLDSDKVFNLLTLQLEKHSEDYGSTLAVEEIGKVINPPTYELYGGINVVHNLNERMRDAVGRAIRRCKRLLGKDREFNSCVARELKESYNAVKWWYDRLDERKLKKDLKTIYKRLSIIWSKHE